MRSCIVGIGNELRKDDAMGLEIARKLQTMLIGIGVFLISDSFFELPDLLLAFDTIFIIDAVSPAGLPGRISIKEYVINSGLNHHVYSLHDMEIFWSLQYACHRGFRPKIFLIGVEGEDLSWGMGLSLSLRERLFQLAKEVKTLILEICNHPINKA